MLIFNEYYSFPSVQTRSQSSLLPDLKEQETRESDRTWEQGSLLSSEKQVIFV